MRTSGILTIGGAFVAILGGAFALLMMKAFVVDKGQGFVDLSGLIVGGAVCALGVVLMAAGRKRARTESENDERNFSEMAMALARKNGGQVQVEQVAKASGLPREEATARMRQLTGRGFFDMDFDQNGQMVWKLSPDAGRAQLAEIAGRGGGESSAPPLSWSWRLPANLKSAASVWKTPTAAQGRSAGRSTSAWTSRGPRSASR